MQEDPALRAGVQHLIPLIDSKVRTGNVLPGGKVTGVKARGSTSTHIRSTVETQDVSGEVTGVDYEE